MTRAAALGIALVAAACTEIPEPRERDPLPRPDAGEIPDANMSGDYEGPCQVVGSFESRGIAPIAFFEGKPEGAKVNSLFVLVDFGSQGIWRLDTYAAGWPDELRGHVLDLGVGANADLATCVHCFVAATQCDELGSCNQGPYFPLSGRAVVAQMAEEPGQASYVELADVEVGRVSVADDLSITRLPDEPCFFFSKFLITDEVAEIPYPCFQGFHCDIAETAGDRHPQ